MSGLKKIIVPASLLACGFLVGACELTNSGAPETDLDADLVAALTYEGQRTLSEFLLPTSDDFASIPQDPANPLTAAKVELGRLLFHETALATNPVHESGRGTYSCASCHHAAAGFQAGRPRSVGDGGVGWGVRGEGRRMNLEYAEAEVDAPYLRSPTILNAAYQRVMLWDGSMGANGPNEATAGLWTDGTPLETNKLGYDGVESQSISALTSHRMSRVDSSIVPTHPTYRNLFEQAFPGEPVSKRVVGLAMAAYQRTVLANEAPFQKWLRGDYDAMSDEEKRGALLFVGKAQCETCHTGPALNSMAFYALGMADMNAPGLIGHAPQALGRGGFLNDRAEDFKFKVPQLYNLIDSPFYGHGGTFGTIKEIVEYYNDAVPDVEIPFEILAPRFETLDLTPTEIDELVEFLTVSLRDPDLRRYEPSSVPSGNCIPANDPAARVSLGCQ